MDSSCLRFIDWLGWSFLKIIYFYNQNGIYIKRYYECVGYNSIMFLRIDTSFRNFFLNSLGKHRKCNIGRFITSLLELVTGGFLGGWNQMCLKLDGEPTTKIIKVQNL